MLPFDFDVGFFWDFGLKAAFSDVSILEFTKAVKSYWVLGVNSRDLFFSNLKVANLLVTTYKK